jgi:beta-mannanase
LGQPPACSRDIIAGKYDGYIWNIGTDIKWFGSRVIVRWAHEMESNKTYPWARQSLLLYIAAFQHVATDNQAAWVSALFASCRYYPLLEALIWFNAKDSSDWGDGHLPRLENQLVDLEMIIVHLVHLLSKDIEQWSDILHS